MDKFYDKVHGIKRPKINIPKTIHQIWLGSKLPEAFYRFSKTWKKLHPNWNYKLWHDNNLPKLINYDLFKSKTNYGERSDILRYEIIYLYGGLYVDIDFQCLKNIEPFFKHTNLIVDQCGLNGKKYKFTAGGGIFAAVPKHAFLKQTIKELPRFRHHSSIPKRTGPYFFNKMFKSYIKQYPNTSYTILPGKKFYPFDYRADNQRVGVMMTRKRGFDFSECHHAYAIHHYAGSWITV